MNEQDHDALIKEAHIHHRRLSSISSLDDPLVSFFEGTATPKDLGILNSPPKEGTTRSKAVTTGSAMSVTATILEDYGRLKLEVTRLRTSCNITSTPSTPSTPSTSSTSSTTSTQFRRHVVEIQRLRELLSDTEDQFDIATSQLQDSTSKQEQQRHTHEQQRHAHEHEVASLRESLRSVKRAAAAVTTLKPSHKSPSIDFFERQLKQTKTQLAAATENLSERTSTLDRVLSQLDNASKQHEAVQKEWKQREEERVKSVVNKAKDLSRRMKTTHERELNMLRSELAVSKESTQIQEREHKLSIKNAVSIAVKQTTSTLRESHRQKLRDLTDELAKTSAERGNLAEDNDRLRENANLANKRGVEDVSSYQHTQQQLETRLSLLRKRNADMAAEATKMSGQVNALEATVVRLESELATEKEKCAAETKKCEALQEKENQESLKVHLDHERAFGKEVERTKEQREKVRKLEIEGERAKNRTLSLEQTLASERTQYEKERRTQLRHRQQIEQERLVEDESRERNRDEEERQRQRRRLAEKQQESEMSAMQERVLHAETELRVALDRCERLQEEASKARAAATSAFEASEHAKHGVLAHALQAKQSTIDILQEQLLQQQQGHMQHAKRSSEQVRSVQKQHQHACKRMERDFQLALQQAQVGAEKQIENLTARSLSDEKDSKQRTFFITKRHQDEMERMLRTNRSEVSGIQRELEQERERCRVLRQQSSAMARDLEDAATTGMLSILSSIEVSEDGVGMDKMNHGTRTEGITITTPTSMSSPHMLGYRRSGGSSRSSRNSSSSSSSRDVDGKVHNDSDDNIPSLRSSSRNNVTFASKVETFESHQRTPMRQLSHNSQDLHVYHNQGLSAELYRTQLDHVAYRSKTEERLRVARREMASARALEHQLEQQALEYDMRFSPKTL